MSSAFRNFINKFACTAQNIAYYSDYMMKKGLFGISDAEVEHILSSISMLCGLLYEKDVLINIYTRLLAKRLLAKTSINNDAEKIFIEKLKKECGYAIVNKIYNLYQDIDLSEDIVSKFNQGYDQDCPQNIQFTTQILRYGGWPGLSSEACILPYEIQVLADQFSLFYENKYPRRSITWASGLGNFEIRGSFCDKIYTFVVNPYQANILLMFNNQISYRVQELKEASKLSDDDFKANMMKFFNPKMKLFNKESKGKKLIDDEFVTINEHFQSTAIRIDYIPKKTVKDIKFSQKEDLVTINSERKQTLDAIIVKIAKEWRVIKHQELLAEVLKEVNSFKPQPSMIKAQIESLIEREFLARNKNDLTSYNYIP